VCFRSGGEYIRVQCNVFSWLLIFSFSKPVRLSGLSRDSELEPNKRPSEEGDGLPLPMRKALIEPAQQPAWTYPSVRYPAGRRNNYGEPWYS